jgi:hypothetical protein
MLGFGPLGSMPLASAPSTDDLKQATMVDSAAWTGAQLILVDAKIIAAVQAAANELHIAVHSMNFTSNKESQNLKGLVDALVSVCAMAEPEVTIIERILASPKFKAYAKLFAIVATIRGAIDF